LWLLFEARKVSLNWFMPAMANSGAGSFAANRRELAECRPARQANRAFNDAR
jgi:hypothetical protein